MKFGICTSLENSPAVKAAGWDYIEENAQSLLQGTLPDDRWTGPERVKTSALPITVVNVLVPAALKITGPAVDKQKLADYMKTVLSRAQKIGIKTLVLGSGGARNIPDGFDRLLAKRQVVDFAMTCAKLAADHDVTIVLEPLNHKECNIVNFLAEAILIVREVNHPNFQCLVDSYHFWQEDEPLANLENAAASIYHVHVADRDGRTAPGQSQRSDYMPFFEVLKHVGYDRAISVEAGNFIDAPRSYAKVLEFLKYQWDHA